MITYLPFDLTERDESRFWSRVSLPDKSGCMLWLGSVDGHGYGGLSVAGKMRKAHRVSLLISVGAPDSHRKEVAHSCRHRNCVAPAHLRWATRSENLADKRRDGTDQFGERNPQAVLAADQVKEIRQRYASGQVLQAELAAEFGINRSAVGAIVTGVNWSHLSGDDAPVVTGGLPPKTHCVNGHEFTEENTFLRSRARSKRECRTCMRASSRRSRQKARDRETVGLARTNYGGTEAVVLTEDQIAVTIRPLIGGVA